MQTCNYIHQITSNKQAYPDVAFIDKSKKRLKIPKG